MHGRSCVLHTQPTGRVAPGLELGTGTPLWGWILGDRDELRVLPIALLGGTSSRPPLEAPRSTAPWLVDWGIRIELPGSVCWARVWEGIVPLTLSASVGFWLVPSVAPGMKLPEFQFQFSVVLRAGSLLGAPIPNQD